MRSVFTPVSEDKYPHTLKVSHTAQDWCGHSFTQLNHRKSGYELQQYSYFQDEGDRRIQLDNTVLEDEIWTRIRLGDKITLGKQRIVPGLDHIRMKHVEPKPYEASVTQVAEGVNTITTVHYPTLRRTLIITSEAAFPHRIAAWEEKIMDGGKSLITEAVLTHSRKSAYWSEHGTEHAGLRKELGLE